MKTLWLLEKDIFLENHDKIHQAITDCDREFTLCQYVPFGSGFQLLNSPNGELDHPLIFFYGSLQLGNYLKRKTDFHVFLNLPQFKCSYYYPRFGSLLLNNDYVLLPYGDLLRRKDLCKEQLFVRPDSGFKTFTGQVISNLNWEKGIEHIGFYDVNPEELTVLASAKSVGQEWRLVIGTNTSGEQYVVTGSSYKDEIYDPIPDSVKEFANHVLSNIDYHPDPFWTLDICSSSDQLYVLEVGSLSCAGWYGCDPHLIIKAVSEYLETMDWF